MKGFVVICPGQGAQKVGMAQGLLAEFPLARRAFEQAGDILGLDLKRLCLEGPEDQLTKSANLQPALLTLSVAAWRVFHAESGLSPSMAAGHSLGEYSALVIAGALTFEQALQAVHTRGELMDAAMPEGEGTMAAVLGLSNEEVAEVCQEASQGEVVFPANFNAPGQVVISGHTSAVKRAGDLARQKGARRVIPLRVSAAFHTSLMASAARGLAPLLREIPWKTPAFPVVANVDARPYSDAAAIPEGLVRQITSPVRWVETIEYIRDQGLSRFIEPGPGTVLCDLVKRIYPQGWTAGMRDGSDLKAILKEWQGE